MAEWFSGLETAVFVLGEMYLAPYQRLCLCKSQRVVASLRRAIERSSTMEQHPIIRASLARERQLDLLRDGAQPSAALMQASRRRGLRERISLRRAKSAVPASRAVA